MSVVTKEDILYAFQTNQRKRNLLLYSFYKEKYFTKGFTAKFIASKLSQELGITISENMVFLIFHRIAKKDKSPKIIQSCVPVSAADTSQTNQQGKEEPKSDNQQSEFVFKNADEYPKQNPFANVLKDI